MGPWVNPGTLGCISQGKVTSKGLEEQPASPDTDRPKWKEDGRRTGAVQLEIRCSEGRLRGGWGQYCSSAGVQPQGPVLSGWSGVSWQAPGGIPDPSLAEGSHVVGPLGELGLLIHQLGFEVLLVSQDVSRPLSDCLLLTDPNLLCNLLDESEVMAD